MISRRQAHRHPSGEPCELHGERWQEALPLPASSWSPAPGHRRAHVLGNPIPVPTAEEAERAMLERTRSLVEKWNSEIASAPAPQMLQAPAAADWREDALARYANALLCRVEAHPEDGSVYDRIERLLGLVAP